MDPENQIPVSLTLSHGGGVTIEAAAEGAESKAKTFTMDAYNGGVMQTGGWYHPLVIDLAGMEWTDKARPILLQHDPERGLGFTNDIRVEAGALKVSGTLMQNNEEAKKVASDAADGFPWQASIGATVKKARLVKEDEVATVNGAEVAGPVYVVEESVLGEVSFVSLGADDSTSISVAASAGCTEFISFEMEEVIMDPVVEANAPDTSVADAKAEIKAAGLAQLKLQSEITAACAGFPEIAAKIIEEDGDIKDAKLAVAEAKLEASKAVEVPSVIAAKQSTDGFVFDKAVEAAAMKSAGLPESTVVAACGEQAVEESRKHNGIGLKAMVLAAAARNGHHSSSINSATINAAFSTADLSGLLSNIQNKSMDRFWQLQESVVDIIGGFKSVNDYKENTSYRMTLGGSMKPVPAGGELKHGTMGDSSRTHSVDRYGMMLTIDDILIANDDLGAISDMGRQLVNEAYTAKEEAGMAKFMEIAGFWTAGNDNLETTTPLNIDGLNAALENLRLKTDENGKPIQMMGKYLVVPPALEATARQLMVSTTLKGDTDGPDQNIHVGSLQVVVSNYLQNAAYTGYSAADWYVVADPNVHSTFDMSYLNGNRAPLLEQVELPADRLGMGWRCTYSFGADKSEYRAGVKCDAS